jgi:hypothetical protein
VCGPPVLYLKKIPFLSWSYIGGNPLAKLVKVEQIRQKMFLREKKLDRSLWALCLPSPYYHKTLQTHVLVDLLHFSCFQAGVFSLAPEINNFFVV